MKVKVKKNLNAEDKFKLAEYEKKYGVKGQVLDSGDIIAVDPNSENYRIVSEGWVQNADEITDRVRREYRKFVENYVRK